MPMSLMVSSFMPKTCVVHGISTQKIELKQPCKQRVSVIRCKAQTSKPQINPGAGPQINDRPTEAKPDGKESKAPVKKAEDNSKQNIAPAQARKIEATE
ncbi:hypothetical protein BT93_L3546 [Corymbia citriodora subsp. variegata]|uniref:Uncharacterized protein n=1 Tax=Corymbia citriodora subsp. variegata TaxID=360336 RepID=A0A8T0CH99_CORYI|nr:hypothetical protein BT93_L3546 [Corymbia citriodora subsp. variegata]